MWNLGKAIEGTVPQPSSVGAMTGCWVRGEATVQATAGSIGSEVLQNVSNDSSIYSKNMHVSCLENVRIPSSTIFVLAFGTYILLMPKGPSTKTMRTLRFCIRIYNSSWHQKCLALFKTLDP